MNLFPLIFVFKQVQSCVYSGRLNEDFIRNLMWQHQQQQQHQILSTSDNKISTNSHQKVFQNKHRKRPLQKSLFDKVSGLQLVALSKNRLWHRCFPVKLLWTHFFIKHLRMIASGIAIPNDTSKACYQNGFVICFLTSTYGKFMEFLIS